MIFNYHWFDEDKNIEVKARSRDLAIEKIKKITKEARYQIDYNLKSELQEQFEVHL